MKYFLFAFFICCLIIACQKEIHFGTSSNSAPGSSVRCTACSYLPVCDSTVLAYIDSTATGLDTTKNTLAILGDTTINGRKFTKVSPFAVFNQGLTYNCDGGDYRIYQPVPNLGINIDSLFQSLGFPTGTISIPAKVQTTILKAGANTGATWTDTVFSAAPLPLFTITAKLDYKVEEKGIQRTVLGKTFTNVIHVSSKFNVAIPLMPLPFDLTVDYYFSDGVGLIESRTVSNGAIQSQSKLYQYKIK